MSCLPQKTHKSLLVRKAVTTFSTLKSINLLKDETMPLRLWESECFHALLSFTIFQPLVLPLGK